MDRPDDYIPDTVTELIYGTYINSEECNKLILENNIYKLTPEQLSSIRDPSTDAYWQMDHMGKGRFSEGEWLILFPYPLDRDLTSANHSGCYVVGILLGTFEDDMSYRVNDAYCGYGRERLEELQLTKSCRYLLIHDVSHSKPRSGVAGLLDTR